MSCGCIVSMKAHFLFGSFSTTRKRGAEGFNNFLVRIMEWGKGGFKDGIVEKLDKVQRCGLLG
jgi:hypothetical protein